jgi:hypothetical protein
MGKSVDSVHGLWTMLAQYTMDRRHCRMPKLIRARPSAASVAGVARQGREEVKGSTRVLVLGSLGHGKRWSGGAPAVKASVAATGEEQWEEEMPRHPFIGSDGKRGGWASEGNERWQWFAIMVVEAAILGGDQPG